MKLSDALERFDSSKNSRSEKPHRYQVQSEHVVERLTERIQKYPYSIPPDSAWEQVILALNRQGFAKIPNLIPMETVDRLLKELEACLIDPEKNKSTSFYGLKNPYFTKVIDPLIHAPSILPLAVGDKIIPIVSEYFGCKPLLASANLRRSFVSNAPPGGNQLYHVDQNTTLMVKVFFYLNDVDLGGGPFMYVSESYKKKHQGWDKKYLWSHQEIKDIYGLENMVPLTAKAGDAVLALTNRGFHCGLPPLERDRSMLTLNYMVHPESHGSWRITEAQYNQLTLDEKPIVEILERV